MSNWWLPESISTYGAKIDDVFYAILAVTGLMFFVVEALLVFFAIRYRSRPNAKVKFVHGHKSLEVVWSVIPAILLVFLALQSEKIWSEIKGSTPTPDVAIEVTAQQFAWNVRYPQSGVNTLNQLHIPVGKKVVVNLTSKDVIHSFYVPQFRLKQDAVPGSIIPVWFEATKTGNYELVCAEFCGLAHYRMRGYITIEEPEAFEAWLAESKKEAQEEEEEDEW